MTKDEMLEKYSIKSNDRNYSTIQNHIKDAMKEGKDSIIVGKEGYTEFKPNWICKDATVSRLIEDGFIVEEADYDEWEIRW